MAALVLIPAGAMAQTTPVVTTLIPQGDEIGAGWSVATGYPTDVSFDSDLMTDTVTAFYLGPDGSRMNITVGIISEQITEQSEQWLGWIGRWERWTDFKYHDDTVDPASLNMTDVPCPDFTVDCRRFEAPLSPPPVNAAATLYLGPNHIVVFIYAEIGTPDVRAIDITDHVAALVIQPT